MFQISVELILLLMFYKADGLQVKDRYYPRYHFAPEYGWLNDPNGFCVFENEVHLFYQYNPESSLSPGIAHWGHAKSKDFFRWEHLPIAMYPDQWYDQTGVFSGSALIENNTMYLFYTGNEKYPDETPDHINRQALAWTIDGVNVTKYKSNPIINGSVSQPNLRDPKVWIHEDTYYMVLGNSFNNDSLGRVLLYSSNDKISWNNISVLGQSNGSLGYMWECPDFFELDGKFVLLFSPQGVEPQGDKYINVYQCGYIIGDFEYSTKIFTPSSDFKELDHGHDFYATQTTLDNDGRRILIAWFDMWEENYPEGKDGFTGIFTIPRELKLSSEGSVIQVPVEEIVSIRGSQVLEKNGNYSLSDKTAEVNVVAHSVRDIKVFITSDNVKVTISYDAAKGQVTLDRGGTDGIRRTKWRPTGQLKWRIFVDASSVELFCGEGEVTFSSRFFPDGPVVIYLDGEHEVFSVYEIIRTMPQVSSR